ncbi:MAG TPA: Wzy polymerase domain-containing protein [Burkholderiales bacterium]|nr:Wzy polymerase domain-containing protein [Burkholderiales bacterium]
MKAPAAQAISLLLAGCACVLPFLLPYHQLPVLSFHAEWLAAALGTAAALAMLFGRGVPAVSMPAPALWLLPFALFLAVRAASGGQPYPQTSVLASVYVLYAVLLIWLGAELSAAFGIERVALVLAGFILAGALANSLAGVIQFYGRPTLFEDIIADLRGSRAYGNIAQANLYANYLALGESALLLLWLRARVRTGYAACALALLVLGGALSGSHGALLFALWFAALASLAKRARDDSEAQRLKFAAYGVAAAVLAAHAAVPWLNNALALGPVGEGEFDHSLRNSAEPRWLAWLLALRVFTASPVVGVGVGEFAGAAFELGLDPSLASIGEVWTSPHNLPLHLLSETGALGTILALGGLCVWGGQVALRYRADPQPALWWIVAAVGVELTHSLIEFPLWSAHFLGVTALLIGAGATLKTRSPAVSRVSWIAVATACSALCVSLGLTLRDYLRLDATHISGTTVTLASAADAQRDAATMRELTHGLMAPLAELWLVAGAPLNRSDLAAKLAMSERVARYWPANAVVVRRAVFLALDGKTEKARSLLERALQTFPHRRVATISILEQALAADPAAIEPLLATAKSAYDPANHSRE